MLASDPGRQIRFMMLMPWGRVGSNLLLAGISEAFDRRSHKLANETFNTKVRPERQIGWLRQFYDDPTPALIGCKQNRLALTRPDAVARVLTKFDVRLIRLSRRNVVKVAISRMRAELYAERARTLTGKPTWGVRNGDHVLGPVALDPERFLEYVATAATAQTLLDQFQPNVPTIDLDYAEIARAPEAAITRARAWLGTPDTRPVTLAFTKATAEDLERDVPNLAQLRQALRGSDLAMLEPLLDSVETAPGSEAVHVQLSVSRRRIDVLPAARLRTLPEPSTAPPEWPVIDRQLMILFTSRVGSTLLCKHIQKTRTASQVGEAFNEKPLRRLQTDRGLATLDDAFAARVAQSVENGWFVVKTGVPGLSIAERLGHMDRSIGATRSILLLRKNVSAQAVSIATATLSGQYHSFNQPVVEVTDDKYDEAFVMTKLDSIVRGCTILLRYLEVMNRPTKLLFYEDFREGDFTKVDTMLDEIGLPVRVQPPPSPEPDLLPVTRGFSADWSARLRRAPAAHALFDRYERVVATAVERYG